MLSKEKIARINELSKLAKEGKLTEELAKLGATIVYGNEYIVNEDINTYFIQPTVITNVQQSMKIMQEETFGPVVAIATFQTLDEAVEIVNEAIIKEVEVYGMQSFFYRALLFFHQLS